MGEWECESVKMWECEMGLYHIISVLYTDISLFMLTPKNIESEVSAPSMNCVWMKPNAAGKHFTMSCIYTQFYTHTHMHTPYIVYYGIYIIHIHQIVYRPHLMWW